MKALVCRYRCAIYEETYMSSDNNVVLTHNLFALYMSGVLRMMINYYRQNEMCTKNCLRIVSLLSL